jgi:hypothetical protein
VWQQRVTSTDEKTLKQEPTQALRPAASLILAHRVRITDPSTTPCQLNTLFIVEIFQKIIVFNDIERTAHKKITIYVTPCRRSPGEVEENKKPSSWVTKISA